MKVTYVDHMGNDLSVVNSARVSFGKVHKEFDPERDTKLISYLARHGHTSPFNHTFITVHVKAPIFVARQLVKHKFMPINEISRRYVDSPPEMYFPDLRLRAENVKQGSSNELATGDEALKLETELVNLVYNSFSLYEKMVKKSEEGGLGICPEVARCYLPQGVFTEWYWSGTLGAFSDMYNLRSKEDTQWETRQVALQVGEIIEPLFPVSWKELTR